ncbi:SusC/RagA family TonB-linked outer membrane protein [Flavobacterium plurextorum]|uniref:SusC/RagA family TonB-linked outer membrane protein n=1 Tax=Flavobacterium TaxID=237 RepID=UPI00214D51A0|nr:MULTISPECIES: SusC/RagA family TonB-linked outer membrane protein [Flavobacterium]UUW08357.1 SusC/RagA family TonB-linked outer membrane protein [Flavobacterium plurextorum]
MKNLSLNKGRPSCLCIFIFAILLSNPIYATELTFGSYTKQLQQQITGTVSDALGPLPSVTVIIKGTATSTVTDKKGNFSITANSTDIIVFSFLGYATQEIRVGNQTSIGVILAEDSTQLQEVTINAGYYSVKDKDRTGSIARITSKEIDQQPVTNVLAAMQGRMAGVSITQSNGTPGSGFDIKIRGQNSLRFGANNPLYVIDGVPYSSDPIGTGANGAVLGASQSPLNSINPEQIDSIEVLKDADATSIYGSRGANGVVLITTKRGKEGKSQFMAKIAGGLGSVTNFMKLMHTEEYLAMRQQAYVNGNGNIPANAYDLNKYDQTRYTNWQETLAGHTAEFTNVDASFSGGNTNTQYLASGSFNKQESIYIRDFDYTKAGFRLNVTHQSENKKFKSNFAIGYTTQNNNQPQDDLMRNAVRVAPNAPALFNQDGSLNWENGTFTNPLRNLEDKYESKTNDWIMSGMLLYAILPGLEVRSNFGLTSLYTNETTTIPSTRFNPSLGIGPDQSTLIASRADRQSWIVEPQISYEKVIGGGNLNLLAGGTFQSQSGQQFVQYAIGFPSNSLIHNISSANEVLNTLSENTEYRYQAFFGRINYNFQQKYILNLTGRRDGSSRFGPGKQYANFAAAGIAWIFTNENFLKDNKWLSFGKFRSSYGITGNDQIGDYQYLDTYTTSGIVYDGVIGLSPSRLFNPDFAWETNKKFEMALELGFLKDRVFLTGAFYNNRSDNQLTGIPQPGTTGFSSLNANLNASVQNKGWEFTLRAANFQNANFSWTISLNLTFQKNKLLKFPDLEGSTYASQYLIGQPLNIRKAYHLLGVNPETGLYTFEDMNGDGIISATDDRKVVLDMNPKYFGGLLNQFRYKRWSLDFLFQFVKQKNLSPELMFGMPGIISNQPTMVSEHWQEPGDITSHQMYAVTSNSAAVAAYNQYVESDGVVVDASYIRLKNLSLTYEIPQSVFKFGTCRVFVEAQNILTFTPYKGNDPEFMSIGYLPPMKVWSTGLQLTF